MIIYSSILWFIIFHQQMRTILRTHWQKRIFITHLCCKSLSFITRLSASQILSMPSLSLNNINWTFRINNIIIIFIFRNMLERSNLPFIYRKHSFINMHMPTNQNLHIVLIKQIFEFRKSMPISITIPIIKGTIKRSMSIGNNAWLILPIKVSLLEILLKLV